MTKTRYLGASGALALTLVCALALSACGASSSSNTASNAVTVDMWSGSADDAKALNAQIDIAKTANPQLNISLRTSPWNDYFTKMTTNLSSGNMACVSGMNSAMLPAYISGLEELTADDLKTAGLSESDFAPGTLDILKDQGKLYGLPFDVATMLVYYNQDMFKASNTPTPSDKWTFEDFERTAKSATANGKFGFAVSTGDFQWMALPIDKSGTQPVNAQGQLDMNNPAFKDAATWYANLVTQDKVSAPMASNTDTGESQYQNGNAAMAVDGTWSAVSYLKNDAGFKAGMLPLPQTDKGSLGLILGSGYGIAKGCKNKDAALKVLGALLSKPSQDYVASSGRSYPARTESQPLYFASIDPEYRDQVRRVFTAAFSNVQGENLTPNWAKVSAYLGPNLVSVFNGQETMSSLLDTVQSQFGN